MTKKMKTFKQVIRERMIDEDDMFLSQLATIGVFPTGEDTYKLSVHGDIFNDRQTIPHLHIFLKDSHKFNLEFSLIDLLVRDKWVRLRVRDFRSGKRIDDRRKTEDWHPYTDVLKMIQEFLFEEDYEIGGCNYIDPFDYAIASWNKEYDFAAYRRNENPLLKRIERNGLNILPKYSRYFEERK